MKSEKASAPDLCLLLGEAELPEQQAQVLHAPLVDPPHPHRNVAVAPRPLADRQLNGKVDRRGHREQLPQLRPRPAGVLSIWAITSSATVRSQLSSISSSSAPRSLKCQ